MTDYPRKQLIQGKVLSDAKKITELNTELNNDLRKQPEAPTKDDEILGTNLSPSGSLNDNLGRKPIENSLINRWVILQSSNVKKSRLKQFGKTNSRNQRP